MLVYTSEDISDIIKIIVAVSLLLTQFIVFFSKFWSEVLRSNICFSVVSSIDQATHVRIDIRNKKFNMNNRTGISQIERKNNIISIEFEKEVYVYSSESNLFIKSKYNVSKPIREVLNSSGLNSTDIENTKKMFGTNNMKIPVPSFFELYKEHIVAPFFVFQLFCILLWVVDDYGVHSFITLTMLTIC
jgi:cation-transporting ATPase 13A1